MPEHSGLWLILKFELPLRELEAFPSPGLTVLLSFLHTRIARQETIAFQNLSQGRIRQNQSPGDAMPHGAGLAEKTAAGERWR